MTSGQNGDSQSSPTPRPPYGHSREKAVLPKLADAMRSWGFTLLAVLFGAVGVIVAWETWLADEWFGDSSEQSTALVATTTSTSTTSTTSPVAGTAQEVNSTVTLTSALGHKSTCLVALYRMGYAEAYKVGAADHYVEVREAVQDVVDGIDDELSNKLTTQALHEGIGVYERAGGQSRTAAADAIGAAVRALIDAIHQAELAELSVQKQAAENWFVPVDAVRAATREEASAECVGENLPRIEVPIGSMSQ